MAYRAKTKDGVTKQQKEFADLYMQGEDGRTAIEKVFNVGSKQSAASMSYRYRRLPSIIAYMRRALHTQEVLDAASKAVIDGLEETKYVRNDDGYVEVPDRTARLASYDRIREIARERPESQSQPSSTGEVIDIEAEADQVFAMRPEKIAISLMPKDFIDDDGETD